MSRLLSLFALFLLSTNMPAMAQTDTKAKTVLDAVSKKVSSLKSFKANFSLNLNGGKGGKVNESKKGTIALKGQKYHVTLSNQEIISDNKTVWTYNREAKEVQVSNYNPTEQTMSPAKLFTPNFYEKEYKYAYKGERKEQGKNCDVVELTPNDKSKQLAKIELLVDKSSNMIAGANYWEKNGNKYTITVSNFAPNADLPDAYFTWNSKDHAGVETVDLR